MFFKNVVNYLIIVKHIKRYYGYALYKRVDHNHHHWTIHFSVLYYVYSPVGLTTAVDGVYEQQAAPEGFYFYRFVAHDRTGNVGFCDFNIQVIGKLDTLDFQINIYIWEYINEMNACGRVSVVEVPWLLVAAFPPIISLLQIDISRQC